MIRRLVIIMILSCAMVGLGLLQPMAADAETLFSGPSQNIAATPVNATAAYVVMTRITVTSGGGAVDGKVQLNSLTLSDNGASALLYSAARVYLASTSSTTLPADAVQIGRTTGTWNGGSTAIPLSSGTTTQRSIYTGTPKYLYILLDMLSSEATRTAQTQVTSIATVSDGTNSAVWTSNAVNLSAGGAKATVTFCTDCHGDITTNSFSFMDGARSATTGSFQGSHNRHVGTVLAYACSYCHIASAASYTTGHRNKLINMTATGFDKPGAGKQGGSYSKSGATFSFEQSSNPTLGTCSSIYCHSNGNGSFSTPTWGGAMLSDCTGCHGGNSASAAVMPGAHRSHVDSAPKVGFLMTCSQCHNATVTSTTDRTISTWANHVTGSLNVKFNNSALLPNSDNPTYSGLTTTVTNGAAVAPGTYGQCNNVYCHSSGNLTAAGGTIVVSGSVPTFKQPDWNATAIGCSGCHGDGLGNSHPMYATGTGGSTTANSHRKHVESAGLGCAYCHVNTVGTNTTTTPTAVQTAGTPSHLNRTENVSFLLNGGATGNYNPAVGNKTCSATYCHGVSNTSPSWGNFTTCASCHDSSNLLSTGGTNSNRHWIHYETAATATGILSFNSPTAGSYVFGCNNCHPAANHAKGPAGTVAGEVSFNIVLDGTVPTTGNYTVGGTVLTDAKGFNYSANATCSNIYCHSNGGPIGGTISYQTVTWNQNVGVAPNDCSVCHGGQSNSASPIATNFHTTHINQTQYNFSCAECHAGTTTTGTTITDKRNHVDGHTDVVYKPTGSNSDAGAYTRPTCNNLYCHSQGKQNAFPYNVAFNTPITTPSWTGGAFGCNDCHGNTTASLTSGAHVKHLNTLGMTCNTCHKATAANNNTINAATYGNHVNKRVTIQLSASSAATYSGVASGGTNTFQKVVGTPKGACATTTCHGGNSQNWDVVNNDATCVKCHGVATATPAQFTANTDIAAPGYVSTAPVGTGVNTLGNTGVYAGDVSGDSKVGAHNAHLKGIGGYRPGGPGTACTDCHAVNSITDAGHMNGTTTFVWSSLATSGMTATYIQATNSCSVYCHGGSLVGTTGLIGTDPTPTWTDGNYLTQSASAQNSTDCNKCHASPPVSQAKYNHTGISVGAGNCSSCHQHDGNGPTHIDGNLYGAGTCDTCHAYDLDINGDWGMNPKAVEGFGAHAIHISHLKAVSNVTLSAAVDGFGTGVYNQVCGVCHTTQTSLHSMGGTTNVRSITFSDPSLTYQYAVSSGSPTYAGVTGLSSATTAKKTCSNISCHFQTTPVWQGY